MELSYNKEYLRRGALTILGSAALGCGGLAASNALEAREHVDDVVMAPSVDTAYENAEAYADASTDALLLGMASFVSMTGFLVVEGASRHRAAPPRLFAQVK